MPPVCSVREQNWLDNYQSARLYAEKKGSLLVPAGYVDENGFRLGVWISKLRAARKARPGSFQVTPEHIALLDAIGMVGRPGGQVGRSVPPCRRVLAPPTAICWCR